MVNQDQIVEELGKIYKILTLVHGETLEKKLSKITTSNEQKKIWVLINGKRTAKDIARVVGVSVRSVNRFLAIESRAGLVDNPWGKSPRRLIHYVLPSWIELIEIPGEEEKKENKTSLPTSNEISNKKSM